MSDDRYNVEELYGYGSVEGYSIMPPCCADQLTHTISLQSIIKNGECWNCGTEIDVELILKD